MFHLGVSRRVGVDAIEPDRLKRRLERNPTLAFELFTVGERRYCASQATPIEHLAARFCAKEAVVKALTLDGFDPLEVEVLDPAPAPIIRLHGDVEARAASLGVHVVVSLTHLESIAIAVAIAERWSLAARVRHALLSPRTRTPDR